MDQVDDFEYSGFLEDTFVREAVHTSLDGAHSYAKGWQNPQEQDAEFFPDSVDLWGNAADLRQGWSSLS